ncbi:MAG: type III-A CRISPR-associated protein Cas10/Csm1, partial [Candidatus Binatia bacterium]|nr:type III-A CRISPR-associated protein Cas10/Csm1 [Candidatus Binatia bacterium]
MTFSEAQVTWLAALLHDIGKFHERTLRPLPSWASSYRNEAKYSHEPFSALFVDDFLGSWTGDIHTLRRLVLKHHTPSLPDELLVALADRLSANERAEAEGDVEGARGRAESVLRTVLSRVELTQQRGDAPLYHDLVALSLNREVLFPKRTVSGSAGAYAALWQAFTQEVGRIPRGDFLTLLAVLRKFTWAIPSDTRYDIVPDISLYQHLKTTAAIAACLLREELDEHELQTLLAALTHLFRKEPLTPAEKDLVRRNLCALVKGDVSGTQDFLYLLTSSGAARGLRGRSFYLQLLTEVIADWILHQFHLLPTNLLFAGGGHFYLLLPYREVEERLDALKRQIAQKLWRAHRGDLSLTVDFVPVTALDFLEGEAGGNAFADKWGAVSRRVDEHKRRKWRHMGSDTMLRELFTACQQGTTAEEMCQVCHGEWKPNVDRLDDDIRKCRRCVQFEELGRSLRDPTHLVIFTVPAAEPPDPWDWRGVLRAFGAEVWFVRKGDEIPPRPRHATAAMVYTFNETNFLRDDVLTRFCWGDLPVRYDFRLLADVTPVKGYDAGGNPIIAEFSDLAEASQGVKWLGVLRMDVDSLGEVFKGGLGKQATISRMSTLSESLRLFFEGWVPQLCRRYNRFAQGDKDRLYLIYAGGDDLFIVGAWSVLPELAKQIRDDFRLFVGGDQVTLSGGIAIEHQKFPLYQVASDAKHALDGQAKEFTRQGGRGKDALCFLRTAIGWERVEELMQWKDTLLRLLAPGNGTTPLPRALLTRLAEIAALYSENGARKRRLHRQGKITLEQMEEMVHYDKWQWRLAYQLSRFAERYPDHKDTIAALQRAIVRERDGVISFLHVLARWAELSTREG